METLLVLLLGGAASRGRGLTWWRIYTGEYAGRYTRRRGLVSILNGWGLLA